MNNEELAMRIKAGERERLAELWGQVRKLIHLFANRYRTLQERYCIADSEDFIQCGYFAMLNAIEAYTPEKDYKFTSYLHLHYKNSVCEMLGGRSRMKLPPPVSLNAPIKEDGETELLAMLEDESSGDIADNLEQVEIQKIVAYAIDQLSDKQGAIIKGIFFEEKTLIQLAKELNVSSGERARQIKNKAIQRLRGMPVLRELYFDYYGYYEPTPPSYEKSTPENIAIYNESWEKWRANLLKEMGRLHNGL